jgi:hypothetical protein
MMGDLKVSRKDRIKGLFRRPSPNTSSNKQDEGGRHVTNEAGKNAIKPTTSSLVEVNKNRPSTSSVSALGTEKENPSSIPAAVDRWKQAWLSLDAKTQQLLLFQTTDSDENTEAKNNTKTDAKYDAETDAKSILPTLLSLVEQKRQLAEKDAWKVDFAGRRVILKDAVGKLASWIKTYQDIRDTLVSMDPLHAALPWAAVKVVVRVRSSMTPAFRSTNSHTHQIATAEEAQSRLMLLGIERVAYLITTGKIYEKLYLDGSDTPADAALQDAKRELSDLIERLYVKILSFLARCIRAFSTDRSSSHPLSVLRILLKPNEISDMITEMADTEVQVSAAATLCERYASKVVADKSEASFKRIQEELKNKMDGLEMDAAKFWNKLDEDERVTIMQWVSNIPYETDHYVARKGRVEGTGEWLLHHSTFESWRNANASTILWLYGIRTYCCLCAANLSHQRRH